MLDEGEQRSPALGVEGGGPGENEVENDPYSPDVDGLRVCVKVEDLGSNVLGRPAGSGQDARVVEGVGQAKVEDLDHQPGLSRGHHDVFWLEIAVRQSERVDVDESLRQLADDGGSVGLGQVVDGLEVGQELGARHVLQHEVQCGCCLDVLDHPDNVGVGEARVDLDLAAGLGNRLCRHPALLDHLDRIRGLLRGGGVAVSRVDDRGGAPAEFGNQSVGKRGRGWRGE